MKEWIIVENLKLIYYNKKDLFIFNISYNISFLLQFFLSPNIYLLYNQPLIFPSQSNSLNLEPNKKNFK